MWYLKENFMTDSNTVFATGINIKNLKGTSSLQDCMFFLHEKKDFFLYIDHELHEMVHSQIIVCIPSFHFTESRQ